MKVLTHPRLLMIYAITALGYGGVFTGLYLPGADDAGAGRFQSVSGELDPAGPWCLGRYR